VDSTMTTQSQPSLVDTFRNVLAEGLTMHLHSSTQSKEVFLWLQGGPLPEDRGRRRSQSRAASPHLLCWRPTGSVSRRAYQLDLSEVLFVEVGKQTPVLRTGSGAGVDEDHCLSLITPNMSVDFEASSKVEREAMAQGFALLINDIKTGDYLV